MDFLKSIVCQSLLSFQFTGPFQFFFLVDNYVLASFGTFETFIFFSLFIFCHFYVNLKFSIVNKQIQFKCFTCKLDISKKTNTWTFQKREKRNTDRIIALHSQNVILFKLPRILVIFWENKFQRNQAKWSNVSMELSPWTKMFAVILCYTRAK